MTPEQRQATIADTIEHLGWFKIPHTVDQVIGLHAEATSELACTTARFRSNDQIVDGIRAGAAEGRGSKGGHSDPTPAAALAGQPDAVDDDVTVESIDAALALLTEGVLEAADMLGCALSPPLAHGGRQARVSDAVADLHRLTGYLHAADNLPRPEANHLDWVLRTSVGETAQWLHEKGEAIWRASKGETRQVVEQKPITECRNCKSHGVTGTSSRVKDLCEHCARFQSEHKCLPDQRICRAWDRGSKSIPNGWVMEAQASAKIKPGRSRAS